jgi:hypothetical protein
MINLLERHDDRHVQVHLLARPRVPGMFIAHADADASEEEGHAPARMSSGSSGLFRPERVLSGSEPSL